MTAMPVTTRARASAEVDLDRAYVFSFWIRDCLANTVESGHILGRS